MRILTDKTTTVNAVMTLTVYVGDEERGQVPGELELCSELHLGREAGIWTVENRDTIL
jgi:hypothetical protein